MCVEAEIAPGLECDIVPYLWTIQSTSKAQGPSESASGPESSDGRKSRHGRSVYRCHLLLPFNSYAYDRRSEDHRRLASRNV